MAKLRVLVTGVDLAVEGGVASYLRAVMPRLTCQVDHAVVGSRPASGCMVGRLFVDYTRFWRQLRKADYDVVHLNPSLNARSLVRDSVLLLMARARHMRCLVFFHGWDPECERSLRSPILRAAFRRTYLRADHIVVLAAQFADALRELGSTVPTSIATTAVEDEAFNLSHNDVAQRDVTQDAKWKILFLSRLEERKGVLTAVDTAKELMLRGHSVELTIVGDGPALSAVRKRLASDSGPRVEMVGYIRDTAKWQTIRSAHIFIFPTEYGEGMPIALLEAMACGLPIVCRPVAGIGDFFEDGRMGHGTLSTSPKDFASLVESVLSDATRARDIGEYNSRYAMSHFSSEAAAVALERVYADIHGM